MVPFSLRLLIAQIPAYIEKHQKALTRLHLMLATIRKVFDFFFFLSTLCKNGEKYQFLLIN